MAGLGDDGSDGIAEDVGEAELASLVSEGEFFVIDSELVEDGGIEIVDGDGIRGNAVAKVVGGAV